MPEKTTAYRKAGHVYTLEPCHSPELRQCGFKHAGYRDTERVGFFKTRRDFEEFVNTDPVITNYNPACSEAYKAEAWANLQASTMLGALMAQTLEPCPKCGSQNLRVAQAFMPSDTDEKRVQVRCSNCEWLGPESDRYNAHNDYAERIAKTTARRRWNKAAKTKESRK